MGLFPLKTIQRPFPPKFLLITFKKSRVIKLWIKYSAHNNRSLIISKDLWMILIVLLKTTLNKCLNMQIKCPNHSKIAHLVEEVLKTMDIIVEETPKIMENRILGIVIRVKTQQIELSEP